MIYFAYGSNLDTVQMRARCPGHAVLGRACLPGHGLCFPRRSPVRGCGTAGIEPSLEDCVWGALYRLTQADVARLHRSEGYHPSGFPPSRHTVMDVAVRREGPDGPWLEAYTYRAVPGRPTPPSPEYMDHLIRGARQHGLPDDYVAKLEATATDAAA